MLSEQSGESEDWVRQYISRPTLREECLTRIAKTDQKATRRIWTVSCPSPERVGKLILNYLHKLDSADFDTRVRMLSKQFNRSEDWIRQHIAPSDSGMEAIEKLARM